MSEIIDGYEQFFDHFNIKREDFFDFGLKNIITIDKGYVSLLWKKLVNDINNRNSSELYIRKFGLDGNKSNLFSKLYRELFDIEINFDKNTKPTQILEEFTGKIKTENAESSVNIRNYQISHIFGNTKNVYCFTAPWNIAYVPKIIDPFTGHEVKGDYVNEFKGLFWKHIIGIFKDEIDEYNELMVQLFPKVEKWTDENVGEIDRRNILSNFTKIEVNEKCSSPNRIVSSTEPL